MYVYIDPRDGSPSTSARARAAACSPISDDHSESRKVARITDLRAVGMEPRIDLLRYGLSDAEAALVEAAAIDLMGKASLTNMAAGYHTGTFVRISSDEVITMLTAKPVTVCEEASVRAP